MEGIKTRSMMEGELEWQNNHVFTNGIGIFLSIHFNADLLPVSLSPVLICHQLIPYSGYFFGGGG